MHEAGIDIQILCIGLLVLGSYFMGKLTRYIKVGETADIIFLMVSPEAKSSEHLQVLAAVALIVRDEENREALRHAADAHEVLNVMRRAASP